MARIMLVRRGTLEHVAERPARIAANTDSSSSNIVSINTATWAPTRRISRVASMPVMSGIWMSITTTSGRSVTAARTASSPVAAVPTSSYPSTGGQQGAETFSYDRVIVGDHDSQCHGCSTASPIAVRSGSRVAGTRKAVQRRPDRRCGRARCGIVRPAQRPARESRSALRRPASRHRRFIPSSCTETCSTACRDSQVTTAAEALECRATLVSASVTMRYAATSTAAGSSGSGVGASTLTCSGAARRPVSPVRPRTPAAPPTSPRLSSAGGPEVVDQSADVLQRTGCLVSQLDQQTPPSRPGRLDQASQRRLGVEDDAGEHRSEPVVQIAPEPPALLLPGGDHLLAGGPKLLSERNRLDGHRNRRASRSRTRASPGSSRGLARAQPDDQLADDLAALAQRRSVPGGRRVAVGGDLAHRAPPLLPTGSASPWPAPASTPGSPARRRRPPRRAELRLRRWRAAGSRRAP